MTVRRKFFLENFTHATFPNAKNMLENNFTIFSSIFFILTVILNGENL